MINVNENAVNNLTVINEVLDTFAIPNSKTGKVTFGDLNVETRVVIFTPGLAKKLLNDYNLANRPLSKAHVDFLIRELNNGNWVFNADPIRFDENGLMIDGQHRLHLIVESGRSLAFFVITGLGADVFKSIDSGKKRSGSDVFSIDNISNATQAAAVVKFIYAFNNGKYSENRASIRTLSNSDALQYYYDYDADKIQEAIRFYGKLASQNRAIMTPSLICGFYYLLTEIDQEKGFDFMEKLCSGANLDGNSPINALRNKIIRSKIDKNYKIGNLELLQNITYAWQKYLDGKACKTLKIPSDFEISLNN